MVEFLNTPKRLQEHKSAGRLMLSFTQNLTITFACYARTHIYYSRSNNVAGTLQYIKLPAGTQKVWISLLLAYFQIVYGWKFVCSNSQFSAGTLSAFPFLTSHINIPCNANDLSLYWHDINDSFLSIDFIHRLLITSPHKSSLRLSRTHTHTSKYLLFRPLT